MNLNETEEWMKGSKLMEGSGMNPNETEEWMERSKPMKARRMNPNQIRNEGKDRKKWKDD